ncbi:hypothetical protein JR316_0012232 [Psilocybe cubensis]|uniref:Uncharacterized protein n=2 Tax=Psilocybe cubensis TaxID=181762 RepID=A0A8H7XRB6_PSICU|nr:hypothetical protein JR316_0012232 [Psilocybe cubensis]KAH9475121.1 hypothetical protein JR316_0012232 [Psilocybe cubensis]
MPTLTPPSVPGFNPPPGFPTLPSFPSLESGLWPPFSLPTSGISISSNQARGQHRASLKTILISVGVTVVAILGFLVILGVYCKRRKRQHLEHDEHKAHPFTESPSITRQLSQPPDSFEAAQKYIDVLEDRIERMRREAASEMTTAESLVGPTMILQRPAVGEPERVAPPPQYEPI